MRRSISQTAPIFQNPLASNKKWLVFDNLRQAVAFEKVHDWHMKTAIRSPRRSALRLGSRGRIDKVRDKQLRIRRILVPVDFSPDSLGAIEFALPLLKQFGAELHLVHVFPPDYPLASMAIMPLVIPELEVGKQLRQQLKAVARKYGVDIAPGNVHAVRGQPFREVCQLARKTGTDMIVMSTRGNTGLKHIALGSTAERIVRYSPCPVLIVRQPAESKSTRNGNSHLRAKTFQKVLVPIDFSDCSMKGLVYARTLAKKFSARLELFHSVHLDYYVSSDEYARYDFPALMRQAEKDAIQKMRDLVRGTDWNGVKVESLIDVGPPGSAIYDRAQDRHADLIVISTHGRTGLKHMFLGSVAEYVVRHARCSVLVVPAYERQALK